MAVQELPARGDAGVGPPASISNFYVVQKSMRSDTP